MRGDCDEFLCQQLIGPRCRPINHRRQATSVLQDRAVVLWKDFLGCEAGEMDYAPEAIAPSCKMVACGGRSHSGIDPTENHRKAFGDDVRERTGHDMPHKFSKSQDRFIVASLANPPVPIASRG
jgi:hypothetical protein